MDPEVIREVEAVLFASGRFVDANRIAELTEKNKKHVTQALQALQSSYAEAGSALQVVEEDGAWKVHVRDQYLDLVSKVVSDTEVSGPVLETLAVIAWRSPALQADIVHLRGSNTYEHVKELVEGGFVVKESEGRSYRLRITDKFFEYFDIEGRDDIRKMFKQVEAAHREKEMELELQQKRLDKALAEAQQGQSVVVDMPDEQKTLENTKGIGIDDLDKILEKSRETREKVAKDLTKAKPVEEENSAETEAQDAEESVPAEDVEMDEPDQDLEDLTLEKARKIRTDVEESINSLD